MESPQSKKLLDLPNETLINIFEYFSFEEVAKYRIICKRVDQICQNILNSGFQRAVHLHGIVYKRIKAMLPRRESERRNHALSRHADILNSVDIRISMLSMTYSKYMDLNMCCFIPGRVLDEIFNILDLTTQTKNLPLRPLQILQEFRDISSMAIEHFTEKIACHFKKSIECNLTLQNAEKLQRTPSTQSDRSEISLISRCAASNSGSSNTSAEKFRSFHCNHKGKRPTANIKSMNTMKKLKKHITILQKKCTQQGKFLTIFMRKINTLNSQMSHMKRRLDEIDTKNQELFRTIRHCSSDDSQSESLKTREQNSTDDGIAVVSEAKQTFKQSTNDGEKRRDSYNIMDESSALNKRAYKRRYSDI